MTIKEALSWVAQKLKEQNINSAFLDAEVLLSFILQKPKEFLYTYPDYQLTSRQKRKFEKLINKRIKHEPVAYLIGQKEFYGLIFKINKHVLVPRPESEEIIDKVLNIIDTKFVIRDTCYVICDIGTGSGCLIISLAKKFKEQEIIDQFKLYATDISQKALNIAKQNAKLHRVNKYITFLKGNLLKPLKDKRIDLIIANLPYLTKDDVKKEPSIKKEPSKALVGDYSKFFKQISGLKYKPVIIFEDKDGIKIKLDPYH
ncbi:peptide chain release factor N(5)-glutamine methyltransferase [Patescibacteria group bacterium]|nr:peptide chain release factor N(5)-glutamine methyltransferase [Patescibacteria group bacterium]